MKRNAIIATHTYDRFHLDSRIKIETIFLDYFFHSKYQVFTFQLLFMHIPTHYHAAHLKIKQKYNLI